MNKFEAVILYSPDLSSPIINKEEDKFGKIIESLKGKIHEKENWGLKDLSYSINNYKKAFYIHFKFEGNSKTVEEIEKKIKLDSSVLRHLTVKYKKLDTKKEYFQKDINK